MKMYRCPECNKLYPSMYCDLCQKSIPASAATYGGDGTADGTDPIANETLEKIRQLESQNLDLLRCIESNTRVVKIIMIVSAVCSLVSAASVIMTMF